MTLRQVVLAQSAEKEIRRFIDVYGDDQILNQLLTLDDLNPLLRACGSTLTGSLIPLEQAQRPPKILVDSGVTETGVAWRTLQCPGGPLVLQLICSKVNVALWIQEC